MKRYLCVAICVSLLGGLALTAAGSIQVIEAYTDQEMNLIVNNEVLTLSHEGKRLNPILYEGVTYLPLPQLMALLGIDTVYDRSTNTYYIGNKPGGIDFIDEIKPYATDILASHYPSSENKKITIAGETYTHWLQLRYESKLYYNLKGQYKTLTFDVYSEHDEPLHIFGDNGAELFALLTTPRELPSTYVVDVSNVVQLEIEKKQNRNGENNIYLFNIRID